EGTARRRSQPREDGHARRRCRGCVRVEARVPARRRRARRCRGRLRGRGPRRAAGASSALRPPLAASILRPPNRVARARPRLGDRGPLAAQGLNHPVTIGPGPPLNRVPRKAEAFWEGTSREGHPSMDPGELFRYAVERRASDVHLKAGNVPFIRVDGELLPAPFPTPSAPGTPAAPGALMPTPQAEEVARPKRAGVASTPHGGGRLR